MSPRPAEPVAMLSPPRHRLDGLVALSALPARWVGLELPRIAESLGDALVAMLGLDFAYVAIDGAAESLAVDVLRLPGAADEGRAGAVGAALAFWLGGGEAVASIPHPCGSGTVHVAVTPVGGGHPAVLAAAARRDGFPSEAERLLLRAAANQLAVALERQRIEAELRRLNETLEQRVDGRTRELREANRRLRAEIEERRQAEAATRRERRFSELVIESAADGIVAIDRDCRHTVWNAGMEAMTGLPRARVLGRNLFELFPLAAGTSVESAWRSALAGYATALHDRRYRIEETGRAGVFDGNFTPLRGPDGAIIGAIAFLRDITERRRMEDELRQSQKLEAIGQLTGGIAHDFNNLLSAILGNLELIGERTRSPLVAAWVKSASRAAERGARLTGELLAFSRKQRLTAKTVDLNALIAGIGDLLASTIGAMVRVERRLAPELWPVLVDPTQLELVILNLAINARDAMPEGGVLTITTENVPADAPARPRDLAPGHYVALAVRDTGVGMSEEVRAHAIEPFFTTKDSGKGTGLGLSMVYGVVKQSGGTVEIDSAPGEGTTLRLYLPRAGAAGACEAAGEAPAGAAAAERAGRPATILLVEDDEDVRTTAATYLQDRGHRVFQAESGRRALDILDREAAVDLVVADYAMPGMTGADLAARVRAKRPALHILFITGHAEVTALEAADDEDMLLRKPFRLAELGTKVERTLGRSADAERLQTVE